MGDSKKRLRNPVAKPGELKAAWGRVERGDAPSLVYVWGSGENMRSGSRVLASAIEDKRFIPTFTGVEERPSLVEELEERGFDITTLRIFVKKKDNSRG